MQPFSPLAEKTLTGPRPDAADPVRASGPAKADADATPFGAVFHGSSARSGAAKTTSTVPAQTDQAQDGTGPETADGGEATLDETAAQPHDPATSTKPAADAETRTGDATPGAAVEGVALGTQALRDADARTDATDPEGRSGAGAVSERSGAAGATTATRSPEGTTPYRATDQAALGAARQHGDGSAPHASGGSDGTRFPASERIAERQEPERTTQPVTSTGIGASDRPSGTGQAAPPWFASEGAVPRTGRADAIARDERGSLSRGQDDARHPAPGTTSGLANTAPPPVLPGRGADALSQAVISALHAAGGRGETLEGGREFDGLPGLEHRGASANGSTFASFATPARPEMAQTAAMQIAAAIQKGAAGNKAAIELTLTPQELGRVRLTFTQSETGMIVNVHADRAETLELLRRNIDTLAQEFLDIGYESAQFTFDRDDGGTPTAAPSDAMDTAHAGPRPAEDERRPGAPLVLVADRLDIRL